MKILLIDENGVNEYIPLKTTSLDQKEIIKSTDSKTEDAIPKKEKDYLKLYTIADLMKLFDTSRPNIYSWIRKGLLKPISLGGRKYFQKEDIEKMIANNQDGQ